MQKFGIEYEIATKLTLDDVLELENGYDDFISKLYEEQETLMDFHSTKFYRVTFTDKCGTKVLVVHDSINEIVGGMATKEGIDVIRFTNGTLGIIAYYNSYSEIAQLEELSESEYMETE